MADVQPFRAVRYSGSAGQLDDLVAPPYDAVDDDERRDLYARSPFNVLHLTLPESAEQADRLYRSWLETGALVRESEPAVWAAVEDFVGPDGVARSRRGLLASVAAEPYGTGDVLPHERTHPRIRDERLELLRTTGVQPEPILLLADVPIEVEVPDREPDLAARGTRLWRLPATAVPKVEQLLIADGHHRYESAAALGTELGGGARILALVVSSDDPGLHVFPTHRVFIDRPDLERMPEGERCPDLETALERLSGEPHGRSAVVVYRRSGPELVRGGEGELDAQLVDRHGLDGITYTPRVEEAVASVDVGEANAAFLLREPLVTDVFAAARSGVRMPQKSTYFHPKPLAGLLFHPVTA